ncbi:S41 family peptidase [Streptomyces specialis]|uniref:S41 family peptidase n=1 Tax=Streptomyces specialis TaxID=498367 RepID=UPI00073E1B44|nr:S41 family peptidase [Streptomyces specialis]
MHAKTLAASVAVVAALAATGAAPPPHAAPPSVEGVWQTDGYGMAVVVGPDSLTTYDLTAVSCLPGTMAAERSADATGRNGARSYTAAGDRRITVTPSRDGSATLAIASSVGTRTLHRVPALPDICGTQPDTDPLAVFDVFWQTYAEHYPFFDERGVDWQAVRDQYRPLIGEDTGDDELFAVLRAMIEPLHDAHTGLSDGGDREFNGMREDTPPFDLEDLARIDAAVEEAVGVPLTSYANGALSFARLPDGTGYLRVTRFVGFSDEPSYVRWEEELETALDEIPWRRLDGLVVDVRVNGGGADPLALSIASRLTGRTYTAYTKYVRNDPDDPAGYTAGRPITVRPAPGPRYTGPVAVLTGPLTISAGETFTQALTERPAETILIGQNTQGVFSDTMDRALPNGWQFRLPNEEYRTAEGTTYDVTGIPPQHLTPVFTEEELSEGRDSALETALRLLD